MERIEIREANVDDSSLILQFVKELATYERAASSVVATELEVRESLFSSGSPAKALICISNAEPIGFAVYFYNYSTWLGKTGLYLEDLYITPEYRGQGCGKKLLKYLAGIASENGCGRFEWSVLDWNEPAIRFYESIGAKPQEEWVTYRLEGAALKAFSED